MLLPQRCWITDQADNVNISFFNQLREYGRAYLNLLEKEGWKRTLPVAPRISTVPIFNEADDIRDMRTRMGRFDNR
jgi:hypothetical protein